MNAPVRILSISDDDGLRYSRELLLVNEGYETESISSNTALTVAYIGSFDIALICRSVEPERALAVADVLRRYNPNIRVLTISPLEDWPERLRADLEIPSGPEPVLEACRRICGQLSDGKVCFEVSRHE